MTQTVQQGQGTPQGGPPPTTGGPTAMQFFSGWFLFILLLFMLSRTEWGKVLLYYLAWALVALLLVSHYQAITDLFTGVVTTSQGGSSNG